MRQKKLGTLMVLAILVLVGLAVSGCVTKPVFTNAYFPNDSSKYVILGRVSMDVNLLNTGGGFDALLAAAKVKYPKTDDVVNVFVDKTGSDFFQIYTKAKISGIAIDYVEVK